jgi:hypothetical protein
MEDQIKLKISKSDFWIIYGAILDANDMQINYAASQGKPMTEEAREELHQRRKLQEFIYHQFKKQDKAEQLQMF